MGKKIKIKSARLTEANDIWSKISANSPDEAAKIQRRKADLTRTLDMLNKALEKAEANGNVEKAAAIQAEIDKLTKLKNELDGIPLEPENNAGGSASGEGKTQNQNQNGGGQGGEDEEVDNQPYDVEGTDVSGGKNKDGEKGEDEGIGSTEGSNSNSGGGNGNGKGGGKGKPKLDPFAAGRMGQGNGDGEDPDETPLEAMERILSTLKGQALQGALDGLKDFVTAKDFAEYLQENKKKVSNQQLIEAVEDESVFDMSDETFDNIINSALDLVDEVDGVTYSDDINARIKEIEKSFKNPLSKKELEDEDERNKRKDNFKRGIPVKARKGENTKYQNFGTMTEFKFNFSRAINDQVEEIEEDEESWSVINRRHEHDPLVLQPGEKIEDHLDTTIPTIHVYFDCSGSWTDDDVRIGRTAVSVINDLERQGKVELKIYYFSNHVFPDAASARSEGGTGAWELIVDNIGNTGATNVVIMTDSDMEWSARVSDRQITVPGCVWYIWKNGVHAPTLPKKVKGRRGTLEYAFKAN